MSSEQPRCSAASVSTRIPLGQLCPASSRAVLLLASAPECRWDNFVQRAAALFCCERQHQNAAGTTLSSEQPRRFAASVSTRMPLGQLCPASSRAVLLLASARECRWDNLSSEQPRCFAASVSIRMLLGQLCPASSRAVLLLASAPESRWDNFVQRAAALFCC